ncbi:hypothetical protein EHLJMEHL_02895 [Vreelandella titanicae]
MRVETKKGISESERHYVTQWKERGPEEGHGEEWTPVSWHSSAY